MSMTPASLFLALESDEERTGSSFVGVLRLALTLLLLPREMSCFLGGESQSKTISISQCLPN